MTSKEELQKLKKLREKIIAAMEGAADTAEIENYNFDDGNGRLSTKRRNPLDLIKWLDEIDKKIAALERLLQGGGIRSFGTNRYGT
ncbi:MAG: hypothetical protein LBH43_18070 [Treponema sp.]|jgi:hypothetical protein|nr:hypothetical protein [Treponema sp.]